MISKLDKIASKFLAEQIQEERLADAEFGDQAQAEGGPR